MAGDEAELEHCMSEQLPSATNCELTSGVALAIPADSADPVVAVLLGTSCKQCLAF